MKFSSSNDTQIDPKSGPSQPDQGAAALQGKHMPMGTRLASSTAPAAIVTFGLFVMMGSLIAAEYTPVAKEDARVIDTIVPQKADDKEVIIRDQVKKLETVTAPPPAKPFKISKQEVKVPAPKLEGAPPGPVQIEVPPLLDITIYVDDTNAQPLSPPVPVYPTVAITQGIEGECSVRFDVNVKGQPYNIQADCTDRVFERAAKKAVSNVQFALKIVKGQAQERKNVIYPLVFQLT